MMFSQAVDGLVRALGEHLDEPAKDTLRELGLDLRRPLEPGYPLETWFKVMRFGAGLIAPGRPEAEQFELLGRRFVDGYEQTLVGRALLASMRVLGPRRMLERMNRNFRSGNNYTETQLVPRGPNDFELSFNQVKSPEFYRGMLLAGLGRTGATGLAIQLVRHDDQGTTFRVTWS
jgi:uncharacterized protein (TIGR02265 family)